MFSVQFNRTLIGGSYACFLIFIWCIDQNIAMSIVNVLHSRFWKDFCQKFLNDKATRIELPNFQLMLKRSLTFPRILDYWNWDNYEAFCGETYRNGHLKTQEIVQTPIFSSAKDKRKNFKLFLKKKRSSVRVATKFIATNHNFVSMKTILELNTQTFVERLASPITIKFLVSKEISARPWIELLHLK